MPVNTSYRTDARTSARTNIWMGTGSARDDADLYAPPPKHGNQSGLARYIVHFTSGRKLEIISFDERESSYKIMDVTGKQATHLKTIITKIVEIDTDNIVAPSALAAAAQHQPDEVELDDRVKLLLSRLVQASNERSQRAVIDELQDGEGRAFTDGLVQAIYKTTGSTQAYARTALVERFNAFTPAVLKSKLRSSDEETQLAAAIAAGSASLELTVALIELTDKNDRLAQAARQSLKKLTGQDFGPPLAASATERTAARKRWELWTSAHTK